MRLGVGVIILNNENKVFVGKRRDNPVDNWQMPQGGVDEGEDYTSAMKRELFEETNIKNIEIIKQLDGYYEYELPKNLIGIIWRGKFRGQKQKWFITKFLGNEKEINLRKYYQIFYIYYNNLKWLSLQHAPCLNVIVMVKLFSLKTIKNFLDVLLKRQ